MMNYIFGLFDSLMTTRLWSRDAQRDRVVPPTGYTATLTLFSSAVMAFLSVFALTLSISASRLSVYWGDALANSSTLQISARADQMETQVALALQILKTTPGIEAARVISYEEQQKLLEPWFGPAAPLQRLSLPTLIDITEAASGYNVENLRLRLAADVPGAILDDHARWRRPLVQAANTLWAIGLFCALLILSASGAMITLAARASMSANSQVIAVLRMIGAHDSYVAAAFVQRFTFRTLIGSLIGCALAALLLITFTDPTQQAAILTGLGLEGRDWLRLIVIPVLFTVLALLATYAAAHRVLKGLS